jgi:hypothetical protein
MSVGSALLANSSHFTVSRLLHFHWIKVREAVKMYSALLCLFQALVVLANVEKTIFVAPAAEQLPQDASINNLLLTRLSNQHTSVRTYLNASFPSTTNLKGTQTWLLLDGLVPDHRYEVRICWLAIVCYACYYLNHN